jgi:predicted metalloprotease with PDZ domain
VNLRLVRQVFSLAGVCLFCLIALGVGRASQPIVVAPIEYRLSFPAPEHRWLQVDVLFSQLGDAPLRARMSSASPGRYARHEFAKNVFDVQAFDSTGTEIAMMRPAAHEWVVTDHDGVARVRYRLFGDRIDGTYLAVDTTHAHLNMPATLMWGHGLEDRPVRLTFEPPAGSAWKAATQLFPTDDPMVFTAPNLQYLMDSPIELSDFELYTFVEADPSTLLNRPTFRVALHHNASTGAESYVASVKAIVREMVTVFGEFPVFENNTYTFIADYLTQASGDAMEHRNSAVLTSSGRLDTPGQAQGMLGAVAHEFFHAWNIERIRPHSLEPFDFTDANLSSELWLAEGFTNYYGKLVMMRAGLTTLGRTLDTMGATLDVVLASPGRWLNSAVDVSRLAPFTDAATAIDPTNFENTYVSYYTWGEAIGLGLDLTLRTRTRGAVTLDDYMRALWERFGKPGGSAPGTVDYPYTLADAQDVLGVVSGDDQFADMFFDRFIVGLEVADYAELLDSAGLVLRSRAPGLASLGRVSFGSGMTIVALTPYGSPLYEAGVDRDDVLTALDGAPVGSAGDLARILRSRQPGDAVEVGFLRRGVLFASMMTLVEDPDVEIVTLESTGGRLSPTQVAFRYAWLGSQR